MKPTNNYITTHRKRAGLTQEELAHLLGLKTRAAISLLECGWVPVLLRTLLGLEVLFGSPLTELFAGEHARVRKDVQERARRRAGRYEARSDPTPQDSDTIDFLRNISN